MLQFIFIFEFYLISIYFLSNLMEFQFIFHRISIYFFNIVYKKNPFDTKPTSLNPGDNNTIVFFFSEFFSCVLCVIFFEKK